MSHKDDAAKFLVDALSDQTAKSSAGYDAAMMMISHAQAHATLALVEAQEAANEQARIANLIALAGLQSDHDQDEIARAEALYSLIYSVPHGMDDEHSEIRPEIARALGIEVAE